MAGSSSGGGRAAEGVEEHPAAPAVRPARLADDERVASLMYESAADVYDRYAGSREGALRVLRAAFGRSGTTASAEVVTVAELNGAVVGVLAAFPVDEADGRAARFLRTTLARIAPWRWAAALRIFRLGASAAAPPPPGALYVDALATAPELRRRGVATALLAAAERRARDEGFPSLALETETSNDAAQALYRGLGFHATETRPPLGGLPGFVSFVKLLGSG